SSQPARMTNASSSSDIARRNLQMRQPFPHAPDLVHFGFQTLRHRLRRPLLTQLAGRNIPGHALFNGKRYSFLRTFPAMERVPLRLTTAQVVSGETEHICDFNIAQEGTEASVPFQKAAK